MTVRARLPGLLPRLVESLGAFEPCGTPSTGLRGTWTPAARPQAGCSERHLLSTASVTGRFGGRQHQGARPLPNVARLSLHQPVRGSVEQPQTLLLAVVFLAHREHP